MWEANILIQYKEYSIIKGQCNLNSTKDILCFLFEGAGNSLVLKEAQMEGNWFYGHFLSGPSLNQVFNSGD